MNGSTLSDLGVTMYDQLPKDHLLSSACVL